jgi:hypothetical protein
MILSSPSKKMTKFRKESRGRYVLDGFKISERGEYMIGGMINTFLQCQ